MNLILCTIRIHHANYNYILIPSSLEFHSKMYSNAFFVKLWTPRAQTPQTLGVFICERLNLCIKMMLHAIHTCISITSFLENNNFFLIPTLNPTGSGPMEPRTFVCTNINLHITNMLSKYCSISNVGS